MNRFRKGRNARTKSDIRNGYRAASPARCILMIAAGVTMGYL